MWPKPMDEILKKDMIDAGINVDETMNRFMNNEALLMKFLKKFADDDNMNALGTIIASKNYQEVLPVAHTLKGVCGNLGFTNLYDIFSNMCQECRKERFDDMDRLFAEAKKEYPKIIAVIQKL